MNQLADEMSELAPAYAGRAVLITGGLGFIGSNLAIRLARAGARVTIVDALLPAYGGSRFNVEPVRDRVRVCITDLRNRNELRESVEGQEVVFNLAGQSSHLSSMTDPTTDLAINCESQLVLLETCRSAAPGARLVLASTRQVYGRPQHLPVDESHPTHPVDINGVHKIAAESYYRLYRDVYGMDSVILRLTNTYGPRLDVRSPDKGVVGVFLRQALTGQTLRLFGSGEQRRDFNYVDDVVNALLLAGHHPGVLGDTFNLGHPSSYSLRDFVDVLHELTGCRVESIEFPNDQRAIDIGDYYSDFQRLHQRTGWRPHVDLREGLARTLEFFRQHPSQYLT